MLVKMPGDIPQPFRLIPQAGEAIDIRALKEDAAHSQRVLLGRIGNFREHGGHPGSAQAICNTFLKLLKRPGAWRNLTRLIKALVAASLFQPVPFHVMLFKLALSIARIAPTNYMLAQWCNRTLCMLKVGDMSADTSGVLQPKERK